MAAAPPPAAIITFGTGTKAGDAMKWRLWMRSWRSLPRIACKPTLGHCLGASGLVELAVGLESDYVTLEGGVWFGGHLAAVAVERS